jgi:hypothetical protein
VLKVLGERLRTHADAPEALLYSFPFAQKVLISAVENNLNEWNIS